MAGGTGRSDELLSPEAFASGLSSKALHCRELGHNWRPLRASWDDVARAFDRTLRCSNCRSERVQVLDASGHPVSNRYNYAPGYLATNVEPVGLAALRDSFRLESLSRFLETTPHNLKAV